MLTLPAGRTIVQPPETGSGAARAAVGDDDRTHWP